MPLESATYISDLNTSNPAATDPEGQGDDHLRLLKAVLQTTFPNISGAVTASQDDLNGIAGLASSLSALAAALAAAAFVPSGMIAIWKGSIGTIPTGWKLCDGTNSTPDLRDKFVFGAGGANGPGDTGGANTATVTTSAAGAHDHGASTGPYTLTTTDIPSHTHGTGGSGFPQNLSSGGAQVYVNEYPGGGANYNLVTATQATGGGGDHSHPISAAADHTHTASVSVPSPPFFSLAYIMKS